MARTRGSSTRGMSRRLATNEVADNAGVPSPPPSRITVTGGNAATMDNTAESASIEQEPKKKGRKEKKALTLVFPTVTQAQDPSNVPVQTADGRSILDGKKRMMKKLVASLMADQVRPKSGGQDERTCAQLMEMWSHIDFDVGWRAYKQIVETTQSEHQPDKQQSEQPWMQLSDKPQVVDVEKARIANGGRIPAAWEEVAKSSEHGRKWLAIHRQEDKEAKTKELATAAVALAHLVSEEAQVLTTDAVKAAAAARELMDKAVRASAAADEANRDAEEAFTEAVAAAENSKAVSRGVKRKRRVCDAEDAFTEAAVAAENSKAVWRRAMRRVCDAENAHMS